MIKINRYFIPYIALLLLLGFRGQIITAFVMVFFHEIIHYLTARFYGFTGFDVEILPYGTVLKLKELDDATAKEDMMISISGPIASLILAVFFYLLWKNTDFMSSSFRVYFEGNLAIGIFNLIPAFPLDGGRILRDILSFKRCYREANRITTYISVFCGIIFMFCYIIIFFMGVNSFNLGFIALLIVISSLKEKERIAFIIMGDIIKKKMKFLTRGYIENRSMSIYFKKDLLTALSMVDKNKYNIFTILDDDLNVMDILYEVEIIDALKIYGNITIEEYIKLDDL